MRSIVLSRRLPQFGRHYREFLGRETGRDFGGIFNLSNMADEDLMGDGATSNVVETRLVQTDHQTITVTHCTKDDLLQDSSLISVSANGEPASKRLKLDEDSLLHVSDSNISIKQILFNINQAICLRLDAIEKKLETVSSATRVLEQKIEQLNTSQNKPNSDLDDTTSLFQNSPIKDGSISSTPGSVPKKSGAFVVGLPRSNKAQSASSDTDSPERYVVHMAGTNNLRSPIDQSLQNLGPHVTLITLNSEEDFPNGTWLGDENNPEMRVRVPVTPSDLLHIHSNCRTAEKMALTLLDYLFDRETQAYSNLSGLGKHGKKQLDPLMIYGIRCHLIHNFNITEQDWHRIKQNINSKCRTAYRRKVRGLPLTVKAFRGKAPSTYIQVSENSLGSRVHAHDLGDTSDESLQQAEDAELQIQTEVDVSQAGLIPATAEIIQSANGPIQVLHATPEQVAQLQQTHQIQILQGDQIMQFHTGEGQESIHVAVPMGQQTDTTGIHVITSENGETIQLAPGAVITDVSQDITTRIPKVEDNSD
ncbi:hypothetical protein LSH36_102g03003 [Paralvinella palmiformis]|uniref:Protein BANP n=1 Tax=Paralvinella palmiformis TaxID=53620 RepID=A0AAD9K151_9ANNE|nr:hypothetical protein LSH36_102g03003 [Paralvinella palmiformis]